MKLPRKALAIVVLTFLGMTAILYALLQIMLRLGLLERDFIGWVFALSALLFGVLTWILLQRFVLRPVTNLSAEVNEISSSQDFSRRLPVRSQDEMGSLSREINHLLELLQKQQVEGDHTQDLQRRITQLRTAAEISRLIGAIQEPQSLLRQVADLMRERVNV
jgi:methyl-accepting chemotaxis protein